MTTIATSTLELSVGLAAAALADEAALATGDATAILNTVRGLPGNYGRYFASGNPLVAFVDAAQTVPGLIERGSELRTAVKIAGDALVTAAALTPGEFADAVVALLQALRAACADPADALRLFDNLSLFDWVPSDPGLDGVGKQTTELAAQASMLIRRYAAIALASATVDYRPSSQQDAAALRGRVADVLDAVGIEAADAFADVTYGALMALKVAIVEDLKRRGASLAPIVIRSMPRPLPALVIAWQLYHDAARADDLVARNPAPHSGFMPIEIEALAG